MAFFSKIAPKKPSLTGAKPAPRSPGAVGHAISARELAARHAGKDGARGPRVEPVGSEVSVTGASLVEWTPAQEAFEVAQANPGLCADLENAALLHASGQAAKARALLEEGVRTDHDTKTSPLAWLALFDLMQRADDRAAFDQLALQYVVQFERSPPAWEPKEKKSTPGPRTGGGGTVNLVGKLAATSPYFDSLKRVIASGVREVRVDVMGVTGVEDAGARELADVLAEARRAGVAVTVLRGERLKLMLETAMGQGSAGGQGAWLLSLELLHGANERKAFEDRAVEFAVTFERSPPSWESPEAAHAPAAGAGPAPASEHALPQDGADADTVRWSGVMAGSLVPELGRLAEFATRRALVAVDMSGVERMDFVCAGALLNAINRVESQRKSVQIFGATPIIRALLLLIGISPRHFVKKPQ